MVVELNDINSQGIRIPKAFLDALGMMENDLVELNRVDDNIVITKVKEKSLDVISRNIQFVEKMPEDLLEKTLAYVKAFF